MFSSTNGSQLASLELSASPELRLINHHDTCQKRARGEL
jgi:hypothetical protein